MSVTVQYRPFKGMTVFVLTESELKISLDLYGVNIITVDHEPCEKGSTKQDLLDNHFVQL